jgi:hypothetical protein
MTDLSPAAQAVLDAYMNNCGWLDGPLEKDYRCAAAVLRAAADQVVPEQLAEPHGTGFRWGGWAGEQGARDKLLAIAAELDNTSPALVVTTPNLLQDT